MYQSLSSFGRWPAWAGSRLSLAHQCAKCLLILAVALVCGRVERSAGEAVTRDEVAKQTTTVSGPDALEMEADALAQAITNQIHALTQISKNDSSKSSNFLFGAAVVLGGLFFLWKIAVKVAEISNRRLDPWTARVPSAMETAAEQQSFSEFATDFITRASVAEAAAAQPLKAGADLIPASVQAPAAPPPPGPVEIFLANSGRRLEAVRKLFSDIGRADAELDRQKMLGELREQVHLLRREADLPAARPLWQVTSALDGLLHQLVDRPHNVTPSTLRTVAGAIDVLHALRLRGLNPDLATKPPVRLLVVDDDAICRHAVAFSLKKIFGPPDVASDGEAALALAEANAYDAVFLDIQMPRMDGFELCSRIHGTMANATTPVVFVTCRSDFDARTRSMMMGGQDLLAKPFLTFELTVKALSLVLWRRLDGRVAAPAANPEVSPTAAKEPEGVVSESADLLEPVAAA